MTRASRHHSFDFRDDDSDFIRKSKERWNRWLAVERRDVTLSEGYLQGRLKLAFKLSYSLAPDEFDLFAELMVVNGDVGHDCAPNVHSSSDFGDTSYGNDKPVLVQVGQFVECGERRVPSVVRLYFIDQEIPERLWKPPLLRNLTKGTYEPVPVISNWEVNLSGRVVTRADCGGKGVIKRGSEAVDSIANGQRDILIERLGDHLYECVVGLRLSINDDTISFARHVGDQGLKVIDVMFGPTDS
jgi:hypothetical protein